MSSVDQVKTFASEETSANALAGGGASPFGNFYNYYSFNPVEQRFCHLPHDLAPVLRATRRAALDAPSASSTEGNTLTFLDVGCNEGNIAFAMAELLARQLQVADSDASSSSGPVTIRGVGVDIDSVLVGRAIAKAPTYPFFSNEACGAAGAEEHASVRMQLSFLHGNIMEDETIDTARTLLSRASTKAEADSSDKSPLSATVSAYGPLPALMSPGVGIAVPATAVPAEVLSASALAVSAAPNSSSASDVAALAPITPLPAPVFDIAFAFSVTLWVHLHHGDEGLRRFLLRLCSLARHIIIEPQPWKCYGTCRRRWRKAGACDPPHLARLEWRGDVAGRIVKCLVEEGGMVVRRRLGQTKWERELVWLTRKEDMPVDTAAGATPAEDVVQAQK